MPEKPSQTQKKKSAPYELGRDLYFGPYFSNQVKGLDAFAEMDDTQQRFVSAHINYLLLRQLGAVTLQLGKVQAALEALPEEITQAQYEAMQKLREEMEQEEAGKDPSDKDADDSDEGKAGGENADVENADVDPEEEAEEAPTLEDGVDEEDPEE